MAKLKAAATFKIGLSEVVNTWLLQEQVLSGQRENSCSPDSIKAGTTRAIVSRKLKADAKWQEFRAGEKFQQLVKDTKVAGVVSGTTSAPQVKPISPPGPTSAELAQMPFWKRAKMLKALPLDVLCDDAGVLLSQRSKSERLKSGLAKPSPLPNGKTKGESSGATSQRSMTSARASSFRSSAKPDSSPPLLHRSGRSPRSTPRASTGKVSINRKSRTTESHNAFAVTQAPPAIKQDSEPSQPLIES